MLSNIKLYRKMPKHLEVRVSTIEADFNFQVEPRIKGHAFFDMVCKTLGVRETWFFGLQYSDTKNINCWLVMDKKILEQDIPFKDTMQFYFRVKFFPEDVSEELFQEVTQHLFYLQVKQDIIEENIYCPTETTLLLAAYSVQSKYGDYDSTVYKKGFLKDEILIPNRVMKQFRSKGEDWEDRIVVWYSQRKGLLRDETEMEYLQIAQDLDTYGVTYFEIKNKKNSDLWLGVDALGLNIYEFNDKITPKIAFPWSEIRNISFYDKKFSIKPFDKRSPDFTFFTSRVRINRHILQLCIGNHDLFMKRRNVDSIELQQIKIQAKEERARKQADKNRLIREKEARIVAEIQNQELEKKLKLFQTENQNMVNTISASKSTIINSNSNTSIQDNVQHLNRKPSADNNINIGRSASELKDFTTPQPEDILTINRDIQLALQQTAENITNIKDKNQLGAENSESALGIEVAVDLVGLSGHEIMELTREMEKKHEECKAKSRYIEEQLHLYRLHMEKLKLEETMSPAEMKHQESISRGETRYSTLNKAKDGSTKNRIAFFEEL